MNMPEDKALSDYYRDAESWADDRARDGARTLRIAWIVAAVAGGIALIEAVAIVFMLPLKQIEPYAVLVDRQTGYVQPLNLSDNQAIVPDAALVRSMLAQYVVAREGFDINALKENYRKVALWSAGEARSQYIAAVQASNPASPLATLPRQAIITVEIRSLSSIGPDTALVRYATLRSDQSGVPVQQGIWAAVIKYRFSGADMSAASRLTNPLGFQVLRYDRSAELAPGGGAVMAAPEPQAPGQQALPPPLQPQPAPLATPGLVPAR